MKNKPIFIVALVTLLALFALPVWAGGWAVITLEELPTQIVANQPFSIQFAVRQHGRTLMADLEPDIRITNPNSHKGFVYSAGPVKGRPGIYTAELTLPETGTWRWSIDAFTMEQPMPDLVVVANGLPEPAGQPAPSGAMLGVGILGVLVAGAGLLIRPLRQTKAALVLVVIGILVGGAGFASAAGGRGNSAVQAQPAEMAGIDITGKDLFVAKGCITCHLHEGVETRYTTFSTEIGPNLTNYPTSLELLRVWLADPAMLKPETDMPNLDLSKDEIETLAAFLLQK